MTIQERWDAYSKSKQLSAGGLRHPAERFTMTDLEDAFRYAHEQGYIQGMKMQRFMTRQQLGLAEGKTGPEE